MRTVTLLVVLLILGLAGFVVYSVKFANPRVAQELRDNPDGSRAERVMLMTIGDRKTIPVNYLREGARVFIGADGPWWREMQGEGQPVVMLIKGETLGGQARAIVDRPDYTRDVFKRLRPDVPKWLPDFLNGVLVEIELASVVQPADPAAPSAGGSVEDKTSDDPRGSAVDAIRSAPEPSDPGGTGSLLEELNQPPEEPTATPYSENRTRELAEKIFEEVNE